MKIQFFQKCVDSKINVDTKTDISILKLYKDQLSERENIIESILINTLEQLEQFDPKCINIISKPYIEENGLSFIIKKLTDKDFKDHSILQNYFSIEENQQKVNNLIISLNDKQYNLYIKKMNLFNILTIINNNKMKIIEKLEKKISLLFQILNVTYENGNDLTNVTSLNTIKNIPLLQILFSKILNQIKSNSIIKIKRQELVKLCIFFSSNKDSSQILNTFNKINDVDFNNILYKSFQDSKVTQTLLDLNLNNLFSLFHYFNESKENNLCDTLLGISYLNFKIELISKFTAGSFIVLSENLQNFVNTLNKNKQQSNKILNNLNLLKQKITNINIPWINPKKNNKIIDNLNLLANNFILEDINKHDNNGESLLNLLNKSFGINDQKSLQEFCKNNIDLCSKIDSILSIENNQKLLNEIIENILNNKPNKDYQNNINEVSKILKNQKAELTLLKHDNKSFAQLIETDYSKESQDKIILNNQHMQNLNKKIELKNQKKQLEIQNNNNNIKLN